MFNSLKIDAENFIRSTMSYNDDKDPSHISQYFYQEDLFDDSGDDDRGILTDIIEKIRPSFSQRKRILEGKREKVPEDEMRKKRNKVENILIDSGRWVKK